MFLCRVSRKMRTFDESGKSKKTVASMIESTKKDVPGGKKKTKPGACKYDRTFNTAVELCDL